MKGEVSANGRHLGSNDLSHIPGAGMAADVAGANVGMGQNFEDGLLDGMSRLLFAKVLQHHGARPYLGDRVRNSLPRNIWRRAMYGLK